jgi:peroxiredoxin
MARRIVILVLMVATAVGGLFLGMLTRDSADKDKGPVPPTSLLTPGTLFPDVPLLGEDGLTHSTHEILADSGGVVIFMILGCNPCKQMSHEWQTWQHEGKLEGIPLFGVANSPLPLIRLYKENNGITFPIYSDSLGVFSSRYQVSDFPLRLVVSRGHEVQHGTYNPDEPVDLGDVREWMEN